MKIFADLHMHSRFARACSNAINVSNLEKYARIKGLNLLGTGDFTHPVWFKELTSELKEDENGILWTKSKFPFIWQSEISLIYGDRGMVRKIHYIVLAPNSDAVKQINETLGKRGKLKSDGRPILGMQSIEFVELLKGINEQIEIIPAHAWTSWFAIFGSKSGFDSIKECFGDTAKHINAIETGMSSDPEMNWRISGLDNITLVSNSDSHSFWPWRMGRECNVFDFSELTYKNVLQAIRKKKGFLETIETPPAYGKYHHDGHRLCKVSFSPEQSLKNKDTCPKCGRTLTLGVQHRIEQLADRKPGFKPENAIPFKRIIPLSELIAILSKTGIATQKVWLPYNKLIDKFGSEFSVLLDRSRAELSEVIDERLADLIIRNRNDEIIVEPGYDGEYGKLVLDVNTEEKKANNKQKSISDF